MPPKAVDATKRFTRNHRFRGQVPLLQFVVNPPAAVPATELQEGPMAPKAGDARKHAHRNERFRGHGPFQQDRWPALKMLATGRAGGSTASPDNPPARS